MLLFPNKSTVPLTIGSVRSSSKTCGLCMYSCLPADVNVSPGKPTADPWPRGSFTRITVLQSRQGPGKSAVTSSTGEILLPLCSLTFTRVHPIRITVLFFIFNESKVVTPNLYFNLMFGTRCSEEDYCLQCNGSFQKIPNRSRNKGTMDFTRWF